MSHVLQLLGCAPEPLMAYLKALGVFRLVAEQKDNDARAWWRNDTFTLSSALDRDALLEFFLHDYKPTPIVSPWNGGSGFYPRDNRDAITVLCSSDANPAAALSKRCGGCERRQGHDTADQAV